MQPVGLGNTRILNDYAKKIPRTLMWQFFITQKMKMLMTSDRGELVVRYK